MPVDLAVVLIALLSANVPPLASLAVSIAQLLDSHFGMKDVIRMLRQPRPSGPVEPGVVEADPAFAPTQPLGIVGQSAGIAMGGAAPLAPRPGQSLAPVTDVQAREHLWGTSTPGNADIIARTNRRHQSERQNAASNLSGILRELARRNPAFSQIYTDLDVLERLLRVAITADEIILLPRMSGIAPEMARQFFSVLRRSISRYNDACDRRQSELNQQNFSAGRARQAQRAILGDDVLAPNLIWNNDAAELLRQATCTHSTVCVQATVSANGILLQVWFWIFGDRSFRYGEQPVALSEDQRRGTPIDQMVLALMQLLMYLMVDGLSLGEHEGVSVLLDTLNDQRAQYQGSQAGTQARISDAERTYFDIVGEAARERFGAVIGIPEETKSSTPEVADDTAEAVLLSQVRGALSIAQYIPSLAGYASNGVLFLAVRDGVDSEYAYVLAIEGRDVNHLQIAFRPINSSMLANEVKLNQLASEACALYGSHHGQYQRLPGKGVGGAGGRLREVVTPEDT